MVWTFRQLLSACFYFLVVFLVFFSPLELVHMKYITLLPRMVSVGSHNNLEVLNALLSNQKLAVSDIFLCHTADLICQLIGRRDGQWTCQSPHHHSSERHRLAQTRGLMVVTPETRSKPDSRNAGMMMIPNSSRLDARDRTTSSPHVVGSNISVFQFRLEPHIGSLGHSSLSVSRKHL